MGFDFEKIEGWKELTGRQQKFCLAFLRSGNGSAAAKDAGYSARSAEAQASKLRSHPIIRSVITQLRDQFYSEEIMSEAEAQAVLSRIARGKLKNVMNSAGTLIPENDDGIIASISTSESAKGSSLSVKLRDPVAAIAQLAKLQGWGEKEDATTVEVGGVSFSFDFKRGDS